MAEYIEREALMVHIAGVKVHLHGDDDWMGGYRDALQAVGELVQTTKAADVAPVVHSAWVEEITGNGWGEWTNLICKRCGAKHEKVAWPSKWHYCPSCGAKVDLKGGEG